MNDKNNNIKIFTVSIDNYIYKGEYFVISFTDITELKEKSNLLEYQATHDSLTGLSNRQKFHDIFGKEIRRDKRYEHPLSLILFDLDYFKKFNDDFGHDVGDVVLKTVSKITLEAVREHDTVVRWGGEEFIVLLPETDIEGAQMVAEKIRKNIEDCTHEKIPRSFTASFGLTSLIKGDDEDSFIKRADEALYEAKNSGKNTVRTNI